MMNIGRMFMANVQGKVGKVVSGIPIIGGVGKALSDDADEAKEALKIKPPTGKELTEQTLGGELIHNDHPESEQQTERLKKSTAKSQHKTVEPSIFYSNTVDFNYDF